MIEEREFRDHVSQASCKEYGRKMSARLAEDRKKHFRKLCGLQSLYEKTMSRKPPILPCKVCGARRFYLLDFFEISRYKKNPIVKDCVVCKAEKAVLKSRRLSSAQIREMFKDLFEIKPNVKHDVLVEKSILWQEHRYGSEEAVSNATCQHCRSVWPFTDEFFHTSRNTDGNSTLLDTCLACPANRRFFTINDI